MIFPKISCFFILCLYKFLFLKLFWRKKLIWSYFEERNWFEVIGRKIKKLNELKKVITFINDLVFRGILLENQKSQISKWRAILKQADDQRDKCASMWLYVLRITVLISCFKNWDCQFFYQWDSFKLGPWAYYTVFHTNRLILPNTACIS
jgi:hypothetical protein